MSENILQIIMLISTFIYSYLILFCKRSSFIFGILASGIMGYTFFVSDVKVQAILHFIYILIYAYSFFKWGNEKNSPSISNISKRGLILTLVYILTFSLVIGYGFDRIGTEYAYIDAFSAACSMTAVYLLSKKVIEHSYIFIASNIASMYICYMTGDVMAIFSFLIYMIFNIMRVYTWERVRKEEK